tara:strand:- start:47223 stop:52124 length:4902 start_codon:yes stop_codon:yes gene_type:complete
MAVTDEGRKLPGAELKVFKNGSLVETVLTNAKGLANIPCDPNAIYTIEIGGKKGMIKKKIEVNTKGVGPEGAKGDIFFGATVELFEKIEGMDVSILDKPIGKIKYNEEYGFESDADYTKSVQRQLADLEKEFIAKKAAAMKQYSDAIKIADKAFSAEDWEKAAEQYRIAEKVNPDPLETYPSFQLAELKTKLIKIEGDNKRYDEAIGKAEAAVASKNYEIAITEFKKASGYKPKEAYPQTKIKEVQAVLANFTKVEQSYIAAIEQGDNALKVNDLNAAKIAFEEAAGLKSDEPYPKNKLAQINDILTKQEAKKAEYDNAIKAADDALAAKDYETAKVSYQKAATVRPTEQYPEDQIGRVDALMARAAKLNQDYQATVEKGDNALAAKSYQDAKTAFENASKLKPEEAYPKSKLAEIKKTIAEAAEQEKAYNNTLAEGDAAMSSKELEKAKVSYSKASQLKPEETYPNEQIVKIEAQLTAKKELEAKYTASITEGDNALTAKEYDKAILAYKKASGLKGEKEYPKLKLTEIEGLIAELKGKEEGYTKAIANGDASLANEDYESAKKAFEEALTIKDDEYPKSKITEIEEKLKTLAEEKAANEKLETEYQAAITKGDQLGTESKFEDAIVAYKKARNLKPEETYPKEQIGKLNKAIEDAAKEAELAEVQKQYDEKIASADKAFNNGDLENARTAYQEASSLKPDESYPKEKIESINVTLADAAEEDEKYKEAIGSADKLMVEEKWQEAKVKYTEASTLKPDQEFPKEKIKEIDERLADLATKQEEIQLQNEKNAELEAKYTTSINDADELFNADNFEEAKPKYEAALALKDEQYPKDKIKEIGVKLSSLAEQEAAESAQAKIDAEYDGVIAEADASFNTNDFEGAKTKYTAAIAVKDEQYPKDKIAEVDVKLEALAGEEAAKAAAAKAQAKIDGEYDALIAEADASFDQKEFKQAQTSYKAAISLKNDQYPKDQIVKIEAAMEALANTHAAAAKTAKLDKDYLAVLVKGDQALASNDLENALKAFQTAQKIKSEETYPTQKIAEIDGLIASRAAANEDQQAKLTKKYNSFMQAGQAAKDEKDLGKAIFNYEQAKSTLPGEELPSVKIKEIIEIQKQLAAKEDEIRLRKQQAVANESSYQTALANGDKYFNDKNYNDAENEYYLALGLKAEEEYPKGQLDKIRSISDEKKAGKQAEQNTKKEAKQKEERYADLIVQGDNNFKTESYRNSKANFESALRIKPDQEYPQSQISLLNELLKKEVLAEEERRRNLDKPLVIQKGPKATITADGEEKIERIYKELWAKQNSEKNAVLEEQAEVLAKVREEDLEKEESRRQNALERLEEISVSMKDQFEISSQMNLQNYETVKEQESDLQNTSEERLKASERKRKGNMLDKNLLAESIALFNEKRMDETINGKKEMVENEYSELNESTQYKDKKQREYILNTQQKFKDLEKILMEFHQGRSTEFYPKNYEEILKYEEELIEKTTEDTKSSEERRLDYQSNADQKSIELKQFAGKNADSFKNNQLEIETLEEELAEQTTKLEKDSEIRRKKNEEEEFYIGEKKERQDQSSANYPQGVTEKVLENQNNSTTIRRIVVEGTQTDIYEKTLYKWGGIFYTKNGTNITEDIWDKESR